MGKIGHQADEFTYNILINGFSRVGNLEKARALFQEMSEKGCRPNLVSYNTLITGFCKHDMIEEALQFFYEMPKLGFSPDTFT